MNSSCGVRSKFTNSRKSARFSGRSAAAARRRAKSSHFLLLWLPGSPCTQWTKLRGRRCLSTRERTSFVAVLQTENGRVLSWRADNLPSFAFCHVSHTFEELFHRAFHDWTRSGQSFVSMCLSWWSDIWLRRYCLFSRRPSPKLVFTNSLGIKGLNELNWKIKIYFSTASAHPWLP